MDEDVIKKEEQIDEENTTPTANVMPEDEITTLEKQRDEYLAGWQRARADFSNYKRDEYMRMEDAAKYANRELVRELVAVLDSFDLGLTALEKAGTADKGIYMIRAQMEDVLRRFGLQKISIAKGAPFDPAFAEAVAEVEHEGPEHLVVEEIAAGYKLHDKVIRAARVIVSKSAQ